MELERHRSKPSPVERIDVVVVSYNSSDTLRACVAPLAGVDGLEITVVDNASDGSLDVIADLDVRTVASGRNGGFGFGCNLGMRGGTAPYVLFLNPDARIGPDGLVRLVAVLRDDPDAAIAGPRIEDADGVLCASQRRFQRAGSLWAQALFLHRVLRRARWANEIVRAPDAYERVAHPEWVSGACLLARRDVLEVLGGFDEGFFLYCEDMDLCARARAAGHTVRFEPSVVAHHSGGHAAPRASLYPAPACSRVRFADKHAGRARAIAQRTAVAAGSLTHLATSIGRPARARGHRAALITTVARHPRREEDLRATG